MIVDGGVLDNLPLRVVSLFDDDYIKIAVNVLPVREYSIEVVNVDEMEDEEIEKGDLIRVFKTAYRKRRDFNLMMILVQSSQLMMSEIIKKRIEEFSPDILLNVDSPIGSHEFHRAVPAIEAGYSACKEKEEEFLRLLNL